MSDDTKIVKKSVYFPAELADYIDRLSQKENRSFTKQVVNLAYTAIMERDPHWENNGTKQNS